MSEQDDRQAIELFANAAGLPEGERDAWLRNATVSKTIIARVRSMLDADTQQSVLDAPGSGLELIRGISAPQVNNAELWPRLRGHYRVLRLLGEGGSGAVYEAEQASPRRLVALKALRSGPLSQRSLTRFRFEADVLGRLQHPGIAQIYEAGISDDASSEQAFIAMELVRGRPIIEYAEFNRLGIKQRIGLLLMVCDAVSHAHERGIIHRDLKPANILVSDAAEPKVLDFGIARVLDPAGPERATVTQQGDILGTLGYISPEQLAGDPAAVNVRVDVYALGVILHELLTGQRLIDLDKLSLTQAIEAIRHGTSRRASELRPELRGDLETIIERATDRNPDRRYVSVSAFAADLKRHLEGLPIEARQDSRMYVATRIAWRYRAIVLPAAAGFLFALVFGVVAIYQAAAERQARQEVAVALKDAERSRARAVATATELRQTLYSSRLGHALAALTLGDVNRVRSLLDDCPVESRGWEWRYLDRASDQCVASWPIPAGDLSIGTQARDGRSVFVATSDGWVARIAVVDGETQWQRRLSTAYGQMAATLDGFGVVCNAADGRLVRLRTEDGAEEASCILTSGQPNHFVRGVTCQSSTGLIVTSGSDGCVRFYDPASLKLLRSIKAHDRDVMQTAFTPNGALYATVGLDQRARLWDAATDTLLAETRLSEPVPQSVAISSDARMIAVGHQTGPIAVWKPRDSTIDQLIAHQRFVYWLVFSEDDTMLASAGLDAVLRVWNTSTGEIISAQRGEPNQFRWVDFERGSRTLLTLGAFSKLRRWDVVPEPAPPGLSIGRKNITSLQADAKGKRLLVTGEPDVTLVDVASRSIVRRFDLKARWVVQAAWYGEDTAFAVGLGNKLWKINVVSGEVQAFPLGGEGVGLALSVDLPRGRVIIGRDGGLLQIFDVATSKVIHQVTYDKLAVSATCLSPDGQLLAVGVGDQTIRMLDAETYSEVGPTLPMGSAPNSVRFSPDGKRFAAAGESGRAFVWTLNNPAEAVRLQAPLGPVLCVRFMPDGTRVLVTGQDRTARLVHAQTGEELLTLSRHMWSVKSAEVLDDGQTIVTLDYAGQLYFWQSAPKPRR